MTTLTTVAASDIRSAASNIDLRSDYLNRLGTGCRFNPLTLLVGGSLARNQMRIEASWTEARKLSARLS